ncbi:MAG TPA: hypothetical protein VM009_03010 [Terriglobales bacterium]|nr:hypothetical protein [Terriglobales bacterium]
MGPCARFFLSTLLFFAGSAYSQDDQHNLPGDFHTREDDARRLYSVSAFAHGHRHGYEEGYSAADEDIHQGRVQRVFREKDVPKPRGYQKAFGDKRHFRQGFIYGYMAGYRDSFRERSFILPSWVAAIQPFSWMSALPQSEGSFIPAGNLLAIFESGVMDGYRSGLATQVLENDARALASQGSQNCRAQGPRPDGYCDGFTQGFLIGIADSGVSLTVEGAGVVQSSPQPH